MPCTLAWDYPSGDAELYRLYCDGNMVEETTLQHTACWMGDGIQQVAQCCVTAVRGGVESPCSISLSYPIFDTATGCKTPRGAIKQVAIGDDPRQPCSSSEVQIRFMVRPN